MSNNVYEDDVEEAKSTQDMYFTLDMYRKLQQKVFDSKGEKGVHSLCAYLGKKDLFYLLVFILRRRDLIHPWLFSRIREIQAKPDGYLDLWAREHGKSSIITFGRTIFDIISNPEITVGIFSHTRPMAKDFLSQIKLELEQNPLLYHYYPNIFWQYPKKQAPLWSLDKGIVVKRKGNPKEATVEAWGVIDGQPTGKHFSLLIYDDLVTQSSVNSPDMINKVTESWALSLNLGIRGGAQRYIGTRYHYNDTYKTMLDRGVAIPRIYPATSNGKEDGEPVLLSKDDLHKKYKSMGAYVFGCQMLLNPNSDTLRGFKKEWLCFWEPKNVDPKIAYKHNIYIVVDPAGSRKKNSDYTVMLVVGLGADKNWYLIDGIRDRLNLAGRATALFDLHRRYSPINVGYEQYGMQADIEFIKNEQERLNYRFDITPLGGSVPKIERILALGPYFEQKKIYIPHRCPFPTSKGEWADLTHEFILEYSAFPVTSHDDMLDCFARILDPKLDAIFPAQLDHSLPTRAEIDYNMW